MTRRPTPRAAILVEGFTSRLAFGVLSFALPLYARELGMSIAAIGALSSVAAVVSLALKPLTGQVADRWGIRRTLLSALVVRSLLCLGYLLAIVPLHLFVARGAHGVSDAFRDPTVHALIAENGGKRSMASTFAWYQTAKTTAGSIGKSVAGLLLATALGFPLAFAVAFALSLLPVLALLATRSTGRPRGPARVDAYRATPTRVRAARPDPVRQAGAGRARRRPPGLPSYAGLGFLVAGTSAMLTSLFPIIATEYAGLTTSQAGLLYLITPVLAFTGPVWGALADRVSRPLVLAVRGFANIASSVVFLVSPTLAGVWTGKCLDDVGKAAFRPAWGSLMADVANRDPRSRARVMGYLTAGEDAGTILAPIAAGLLWAAGGVPALLLGRVGLAAVSEVYTLLLERRQRRSETSEPRRDTSPSGEDRPELARAGA